MPRVCTVCTHPEREAIDVALAAGEAFRELAALYRVSEDALLRHKAKHLPASAVKAQEARDVARSINVMGELQRAFEKVNLLFDACDRWLRDPSDPDRYTLEPRAEEVFVIYSETDDEGRTKRRKEPLSRLLARAEGGGRAVEGWETKHADPRELVLKTAERLQDQLQLVAKLIGELDERPTVNVLVAPEWLDVRSALLSALYSYPEARAAVAGVLLKLEAGNGRGN